eukprot:5101925-Karenia_brevis.AAC.1
MPLSKIGNTSTNPNDSATFFLAFSGHLIFCLLSTSHRQMGMPIWPAGIQIDWRAWTWVS